MATQAFGKYQTTQLLGRGGMAEVYAGTHPDLGRRVAIKVILPQLAESEGFEERFRREARLVASLRHPHIVQLYDFDFVEGRAFMVMEYLEGGALAERLQAAHSRGETMPLGEAARILDAIGDALDYAHRQVVVHRDIKPGNILFTADNQPVLSDFGIAHLQAGAARLTATGGIIGSPAYMSPEQATGQAVDARSDIYSLGVVLFEMATGRVPFLAETPTAVLLRHVQEPPPPPADLNPNLPKLA
ncbi:MAG: serine/threonine protein kinase, partial [Caldilineales bacterium]|nr:serine/threonine protein kinase [Caldilineales bacterium]